EPARGGWSIKAPAVCLSGDCFSKSSVERVGAGELELYEGDFASGARDGIGRVTTIGPSGVHELSVGYGLGDPDQVVLSRPAYTITCSDADEPIALRGPCTVDLGLPGATFPVTFDDTGRSDIQVTGG